jgi:hypothetical protein
MTAILVVLGVIYVLVGLYLGGAWFAIGRGHDALDVVIATLLGLTWPLWVLLIILSNAW